MKGYRRVRQFFRVGLQTRPRKKAMRAVRQGVTDRFPEVPYLNFTAHPPINPDCILTSSGAVPKRPVLAMILLGKQA